MKKAYKGGRKVYKGFSVTEGQMHTRLVSVNKSQKCIEQSLLLVCQTVSICQLAELSFVQMISDG